MSDASGLGAGSRYSCYYAHAKIKLSYCSTIHLPVKVQGKPFPGKGSCSYSGIHCVRLLGVLNANIAADPARVSMRAV